MANREDVLSDIDWWYDYADYKRYKAQLHYTDAVYYYGVGNDHKALGYIIDLAQEVIGSLTGVISFDQGYGEVGIVPYFLRNHTIEEANGVNMASILLAMLAAKQPELMSFVGIVDAYRQSIWNQPFNQEYYAALARGFTLWE